MHTYLAGVAAYVQAGGSPPSQRLEVRPQRAREAHTGTEDSSRPAQGVVVSISEEAQRSAQQRARAEKMGDTEVTGGEPWLEGQEPEEQKQGPQETHEDLSTEERQELANLRQRDLTVRTRDMAYIAASSGVSGGFTVRYETGPDGRRYAVEADVQLDTSEAATPQQSLSKARALRAALMSAGGAAARDASATARAADMEKRARAELAREQRQTEELGGDGTEPALPDVELEGLEDLEGMPAG